MYVLMTVLAIERTARRAVPMASTKSAMPLELSSVASVQACLKNSVTAVTASPM
ncbi:hypothetical protein D3C71_2086170 [compost metagenome]